MLRLGEDGSGPIGSGLQVADPRPVFDDGVGEGTGGAAAVLGVRCTVCRHPDPQRDLPWCLSCHGPVAPARFAPAGTVWSSTVVAIRVGGWPPPFGLAYLDLDDGPRVLVHLTEPVVLPLGTRAHVIGTDRGDLVAATEQRQ